MTLTHVQVVPSGWYCGIWIQTDWLLCSSCGNNPTIWFFTVTQFFLLFSISSCQVPRMFHVARWKSCKSGSWLSIIKKFNGDGNGILGQQSYINISSITICFSEDFLRNPHKSFCRSIALVVVRTGSCMDNSKFLAYLLESSTGIQVGHT